MEEPEVIVRAALRAAGASPRAVGLQRRGAAAEPAAADDVVVLSERRRANEAARRPRGGIDLAGKRVVVTAGGTREPLDPVRFLGNRSSGRQGVALASAARGPRRRRHPGRRPPRGRRRRTASSCIEVRDRARAAGGGRPRPLAPPTSS